jgi:hypothetical protein
MLLFNLLVVLEPLTLIIIKIKLHKSIYLDSRSFVNKVVFLVSVVLISDLVNPFGTGRILFVLDSFIYFCLIELSNYESMWVLGPTLTCFIAITLNVKFKSRSTELV